MSFLHILNKLKQTLCNFSIKHIKGTKHKVIFNLQEFDLLIPIPVPINGLEQPEYCYYLIVLMEDLKCYGLLDYHSQADITVNQDHKHFNSLLSKLLFYTICLFRHNKIEAFEYYAYYTTLKNFDEFKLISSAIPSTLEQLITDNKSMKGKFNNTKRNILNAKAQNEQFNNIYAELKKWVKSHPIRINTNPRNYIVDFSKTKEITLKDEEYNELINAVKSSITAKTVKNSKKQK